MGVRAVAKAAACIGQQPVDLREVLSKVCAVYVAHCGVVEARGV